MLTCRRNSNRTLSETHTASSTIARITHRHHEDSSDLESSTNTSDDRYRNVSSSRGVVGGRRREGGAGLHQAQHTQSQLVYSQRHSITDIAQTVKQKYGADSLDTGVVCDLCKVTKFASAHAGGRVCSACKSRCCLRCSLRFSVPVVVPPTGQQQQTRRQLLWICVECKRKQDEIVKSLSSSTASSKKRAFATSDYILNKLINQPSINNKSTMITNGSSDAAGPNNNTNNNADKSK